MSRLFSPLSVRDVTLRNRVWVSPMCMYSSRDGCANDWHLVHLGSFARGGAGLVFQEATAVTESGRISTGDAGIWNDEQAASYERITQFVHKQGAATGIQLSHSGRKGAQAMPWSSPAESEPHADWEPVAPSPQAFGHNRTPKQLSETEISGIVKSFGTAAARADQAGFDVVELHAAHGYLIHSFLSPLTNFRKDEYGGDLWARAKILRDIVVNVRSVWPQEKPLFVRLSASDWIEGGSTMEDTIAVVRTLQALGVDLIDVSSGGLDPKQQISVGPSYQAPFAHTLRQATDLLIGSVGQITEPQQAETILALGSADAVFLGRELLRSPHWPLHAARELGADITWPVQYTGAR